MWPVSESAKDDHVSSGDNPDAWSGYVSKRFPNQIAAVPVQIGHINAILASS